MRRKGGAEPRGMRGLGRGLRGQGVSDGSKSAPMVAGEARVTAGFFPAIQIGIFLNEKNNY